MSRAIRASGRTGRSLTNAFRKINRQVLRSMKKTERELLVAGWQFQREVARKTSADTGLPQVQGRRRVKVYRRHMKGERVVVVQLGENSSIIHSGRLKGLKFRKGKLAAGTIPGVADSHKVFLLNPKAWKGTRRRIYKREGNQLKSVNVPKEIVEVFDETAELKAEKLLEDAVRRGMAR